MASCTLPLTAKEAVVPSAWRSALGRLWGVPGGGSIRLPSTTESNTSCRSVLPAGSGSGGSSGGSVAGGGAGMRAGRRQRQQQQQQQQRGLHAQPTPP